MSKSLTAFTLVELMLVVAIITLISAIAVPNFLRARVRAQATSVVNDVRMISSVAEQYAMEQGLGASVQISFNSLVDANLFHFKEGDRMNMGQGIMELPPEATYGILYQNISTATKLTVHHYLREMFTPTLETSDRLWEL